MGVSCVPKYLSWRQRTRGIDCEVWHGELPFVWGISPGTNSGEHHSPLLAINWDDMHRNIYDIELDLIKQH